MPFKKNHIYIHTRTSFLRSNLISLARSTILLFILYYEIICKYLQIYAATVVLGCHRGGERGGSAKDYIIFKSTAQIL